MFFSIVIASLNARKDLSLCIDSINGQNYDSFEIIISDGGSTDGTLEYIQNTAIRNLTWYKSSVDKGIYDALNIALKQATGSWILVLGADDRLSDSDALRRAHEFISVSKDGVDFFYSDLFISDGGAIRLKKYPEIHDFNRMYGGAPFIHHQSAFIARSALIHHGGFLDSYKIHADYDIMLKVFLSSGAIKINDSFVIYSSNGFSSMLNKLSKSFSEICAIRKSHGFNKFSIRLVVLYLKLFIFRIFVK
jgi:glycosyltransferase involved in cell wall biosynthesis